MRKINSKDKGKRGEQDFIAAVCKLLGRERSAGDRRNWQWTTYGGANNPDVEIRELSGFHVEVKNTKLFSFPLWVKTLLEDCSPSKVPVLAYKQERKGFWCLHRLEDVENYAVTWCQALGYEVRKP